MKCPYREFQDCIVEQCPSCNYEMIQTPRIYGRYPPWMNTEEAIRQGMAYEGTVTTYKFVSCKLVDGCVQPVPANKQVINNSTNTSVTVKRSVF